MPAFEIEIKSLLGDVTRAEAFKARLMALSPRLDEVSNQLNHYFVADNDAAASSIEPLYEKTADYLTHLDRDRLRYMVENGAGFSVRTRQLNDQVLLIVKASIDDTTSANGISRLEFEAPVQLSLEKLDALVQAAGYAYQAKWSRQREQYQVGEVTVCLDKNAGYGYLVEFERVVDDAAQVDAVKQQLYDFMAQLDAVELSQERLGRMFSYYNAHWRDYYGTEKTFNVE